MASFEAAKPRSLPHPREIVLSNQEMNMPNSIDSRYDFIRSKRVLITGVGGMLGKAFRQELTHLAPEAVVRATTRSDLDVRDAAAFAAHDNFAPDIVLHCAALVDADFCEDHRDEGHATIVGGTLNAIDFARRHGAILLYPQSFLAFDGATVIDEDTRPAPMSVYGELKAEAEYLVREQLSESALVVRMAGFFGGEDTDDNFVGRITPHLAKLIREGKPSIDIGDRVWQPTYTRDLAKNSLLLLAKQASGVYCMASHGSASFYELTVEIVRALGIGDRIQVGRIEASLLAAKERAPRPLKAVMCNTRLQREGLDLQRPWQSSLAEYLSSPYFADLFK